MGKFTEFKLQLKSMPEGEHEYAYHLGKEFFVNMENDEIHDADIDVKLIATRRGDPFELNFHFTGRYPIPEGGYTT